MKNPVSVRVKNLVLQLELETGAAIAAAATMLCSLVEEVHAQF